MRSPHLQHSSLQQPPLSHSLYKVVKFDSGQSRVRLTPRTSMENIPSIGRQLCNAPMIQYSISTFILCTHLLVRRQQRRQGNHVSQVRVKAKEYFSNFTKLYFQFQSEDQQLQAFPPFKLNKASLPFGGVSQSFHLGKSSCLYRIKKPIYRISQQTRQNCQDAEVTRLSQISR